MGGTEWDFGGYLKIATSLTAYLLAIASLPNKKPEDNASGFWV